MIVTKGAADITTYIMIVDSATGAPETGITIANLDMQYTRNVTAPVAKVDMVALAATNTAHTDNRGIEIDATSSPGLYRVDWPDAAFASGADKVILVVTGTGFAPSVLIVELVNYDTQAALATPTNITAGTITTATNVTTVNGLAANVITAASIANGAIDAATFAAGAIDAAALAADASTEINAAVLAILGTPAGASMSADIAAIEAQTDDIGAAGAGLTAVPWNAAWDAEVQSEVTDALLAALTESYRTNGATGSVAQLLYEIVAHLGESVISGTTKTINGLDHVTPAETFTLDSATTPAAITRAT